MELLPPLPRKEGEPGNEAGNEASKMLILSFSVHSAS